MATSFLTIDDNWICSGHPPYAVFLLVSLIVRDSLARLERQAGASPRPTEWHCHCEGVCARGNPLLQKNATRVGNVT